MQKIRLSFTYQKYQALFLIMRALDFNAISDYNTRVMARFILEKIFAKISRKVLSGFLFNEVTLSLHPAEALALHELLVYGTAPLGDYELGVVYEIIDTIERQTIQINASKLLNHG